MTINETVRPTPVITGRKHVDVIVVDATNLLHRCHHAVAHTDLRGADGAPIWAVNGLFGYLAKLVNTWSPHKVVVGFDVDGCPARKALAPDYKAGRNKTDDTLVSQLELAPKLVEAAGFGVGAVSGWEADDVCATVAVKARGSVGIVSSDKDAHQLIGDHVIVIKPEGTIFDDPALHTKWGVTGSRWVEYAAMIGEKSDNLHGVDGIGPKRATTLIAAFDDIEDAYSDFDATVKAVGRPVAEQLHAGADIFRRNRQVATLRSDLSLGVTGALPDGDQVLEVLDAAGLTVTGQRVAASITRATSPF